MSVRPCLHGQRSPTPSAGKTVAPDVDAWSDPDRLRSGRELSCRQQPAGSRRPSPPGNDQDGRSGTAGCPLDPAFGVTQAWQRDYAFAVPAVGRPPWLPTWGPFVLDDVVAELDALVADVDARPGDQLFNLGLRLSAERASQGAVYPLRRSTAIEHAISIRRSPPARAPSAHRRLPGHQPCPPRLVNEGEWSHRPQAPNLGCVRLPRGGRPGR